MATRRKFRGKYPVPRNAKKACLSRNGTYSRKNWNQEDYWSQGIGKV